MLSIGETIFILSDLDLNTRRVLYTSLILPLFDCGDVIWGEKNNAVLMNSLQVLENKANKLILDKHPRYSSTEALRELKCSTLATRRHNHDARVLSSAKFYNFLEKLRLTTHQT